MAASTFDPLDLRVIKPPPLIPVFYRRLPPR